MKKYGFNSGYIGVDRRTTAIGTINYQKRMLEREANRMRMAGVDIHRDGLVLGLLAENLTDNIGDGWSDSSGNDYHYTFGGGPIITANSYMKYVNLDSTDDYLDSPVGMNPLGSSAGTAVFVMSSTDQQGLFFTQGGGPFLAAYRVGNTMYHSGFGSSITHYHNKLLKNNVYANFPDGTWNMTEFKNIERNSNTGWQFSNYGAYEIVGKLRAVLLYNKVLTAEESAQNYDYFLGQGYLSE